MRGRYVCCCPLQAGRSRNSTTTTTCGPSGGIGEGDLEVQASWEMKPESWEETEERRAEAWRGGAEHDQDDDDDARKRKWAEGECPWEPLERESLLLTLFRLLQGRRGQRSGVQPDQQRVRKKT